MPPGPHPPTAGLNQKRIIEAQRNGRGSSNWGQPQNMETIVAPGKMFMPILLARIKQGDGLVGQGINVVGLCTFVTITQVTGQPQILDIRTTPGGNRDNVFNNVVFWR